MNDKDEEIERLSKSMDDFHKEKEAKRLREWRKNNPDKAKAIRAKWDAKNRKEYQREYRKRKKL